MITGAFWFYSFLLICIYFLCSFIIYHYCIICLGSYLFIYGLSRLYFVPLHNLLLVPLYLWLPYWICFFFLCILLLRLLFKYSSDISVWFSSSALIKHAFSLTAFSFYSLTLLSVSLFLHPFFSNLTSLFWLSFEKSKTFALLLSSDSSVTSCPSILFRNCCSIFNLPNTSFSFWSLISITVLFSGIYSWIIGIFSNKAFASGGHILVSYF